MPNNEWLKLHSTAAGPRFGRALHCTRGPLPGSATGEARGGLLHDKHHHSRLQPIMMALLLLAAAPALPQLGEHTLTMAALFPSQQRPQLHAD